MPPLPSAGDLREFIEWIEMLWIHELCPWWDRAEKWMKSKQLDYTSFSEAGIRPVHRGGVQLGQMSRGLRISVYSGVK